MEFLAGFVLGLVLMAIVVLFFLGKIAKETEKEEVNEETLDIHYMPFDELEMYIETFENPISALRERIVEHRLNAYSYGY